MPSGSHTRSDGTEGVRLGALLPRKLARGRPLGVAQGAPHLTLSRKALAAARRSCLLPFRFSMTLLPWVQAAVLSISATS